MHFWWVLRIENFAHAQILITILDNQQEKVRNNPTKGAPVKFGGRALLQRQGTVCMSAVLDLDL